MIETERLRAAAIQRIELEEALDEVERNEGDPSEINLDDLAQLFGVSEE